MPFALPSSVSVPSARRRLSPATSPSAVIRNRVVLISRIAVADSFTSVAPDGRLAAAASPPLFPALSGGARDQGEQNGGQREDGAESEHTANARRARK
nr:hypothetical protein GCM10020092_025600 [Actinoplanes digitatis]